MSKSSRPVSKRSDRSNTVTSTELSQTCSTTTKQQRPQSNQISLYSAPSSSASSYTTCIHQLLNHPVFQQSTQYLQRLIYLQSNVQQSSQAAVSMVQFIEFSLRIQKAIKPRFQLFRAIEESLRIWDHQLSVLRAQNPHRYRQPIKPINMKDEYETLMLTTMTSSFSASDLLVIIGKQAIPPLSSTNTIGFVIIQNYLMDICVAMCQNMIDAELIGLILNIIVLHLTCESETLKPIDEINLISPGILKQFESMRSYYERHIYQSVVGNQPLWCDWNYFRADDILASLSKKLNAFYENQRSRIACLLPPAPFIHDTQPKVAAELSSLIDKYSLPVEDFSQKSALQSSSSILKNSMAASAINSQQQPGGKAIRENLFTSFYTQVTFLNPEKEQQQQQSLVGAITPPSMLRTLQKRIFMKKPSEQEQKQFEQESDRQWLQTWQLSSDQPKNVFFKLLRLKMESMQRKPITSSKRITAIPQGTTTTRSSSYQQEIERQTTSKQQGVKQIPIASLPYKKQARSLTIEHQESLEDDDENSPYYLQPTSQTSVHTSSTLASKSFQSSRKDVIQHSNIAYQPTMAGSEIYHRTTSNEMYASQFNRSQSWSTKDKKTVAGAALMSSSSINSDNKMNHSSNGSSRKNIGSRNLSRNTSTSDSSEFVNINLTASKNDLVVPATERQEYQPSRSKRVISLTSGLGSSLFNNAKVSALCGSSGHYQSNIVPQQAYQQASLASKALISALSETAPVSPVKKRKKSVRILDVGQIFSSQNSSPNTRHEIEDSKSKLMNQSRFLWKKYIAEDKSAQELATDKMNKLVTDLKSSIQASGETDNPQIGMKQKKKKNNQTIKGTISLNSSPKTILQQKGANKYMQ